MTVQVNPGPGSTSWSVIGYTAGQSSVWTVAVNGTPSFVYSYARTSPITTDGWAAGATVTQAWTQFGADEATTLTVTRTGGITSAVIYPKGVATHSIAGGVLTIACPIDVDLIVEVNGDRKDTLLIFADQLKAAVPAGALNWSAVGPKVVSSVNDSTNRLTFASAHGFVNNERCGLTTTGTLPTAVGGNLAELTSYYIRVVDTTTIELARTSGGAAIDLTSTGTGTHTVYRNTWGASFPLYFGPGVWDIGFLFLPAAGASIYLDAGAVVRGNFDLRTVAGAATGVTIQGPGILSAATTTNEFVFTLLDFNNRILYAAFVGQSGTGGFIHNTEVRDVTVTAMPYYASYEGVNRWARTKLVAPWTWSCDGYRISYKSSIDLSASVTDCFAYVADDVLYIDDYFASLTATGNFLATTQNAIIHSTYWPDPDTGAVQTIEDNDLLHYGIADTDSDESVFPTKGGNAIFKAWTDGAVDEQGEGSFDVLLRNNRVHGPVRSRLFSLANKLYPFVDLGDLTRDRRGEVARWTIDGLTVEQEPGQPSVIEGFDWRNTPHSIAFSGVRIDGTLLTAANWFDYVEQNAYPYFITVGGQPVVTAVDVCNTALDLIGHAKRITSIAPPDGSSEADVCSEHYTDCVNELLDAHQWNFATVKRDLVALDESDDPAWDYCYEVPEGLLRIISILPADSTDNNYTATHAVPVDYEIHADSDDVVRIYTDLPDAWIRFTKYVTNPSLFSPTFLEALQWKLASRIAGPLIKGNEGAAERDRCMQQHMFAMGKATQNDARQQRRVDQKTIASWHRRGALD